MSKCVYCDPCVCHHCKLRKPCWWHNWHRREGVAPGFQFCCEFRACLICKHVQTRFVGSWEYVCADLRAKLYKWVTDGLESPK